MGKLRRVVIENGITEKRIKKMRIQWDLREVKFLKGMEENMRDHEARVAIEVIEIDHNGRECETLEGGSHP